MITNVVAGLNVAPLATSVAPRMKSGLRASRSSGRASPLGSVTLTCRAFVLAWDGDVVDEPQQTAEVSADMPITSQIPLGDRETTIAPPPSAEGGANCQPMAVMSRRWRQSAHWWMQETPPLLGERANG